MIKPLKLFPLLLLLVFAECRCPDVFISEVQEGSGYNKAMELYNPSGIEVSLDGWTWGIHFNGGSSHDKHNNTFGEGASIAAYSVYTLCHTKHTLAGNVSCSEQSGALLQNGNDVLRLYNAEGVLVDEFGVWGSDSWSLCGNPTGNKDHTVVRKPGIVYGAAPFNETTEGSNAEQCSWMLMPVDAFDSAGTHDCIANATVADPDGCGANAHKGLPRTIMEMVIAVLGFSVGGVVLLWGFCTARGRGTNAFQQLSISADSVQVGDDEDWDGN